jgi:hypothetical protein
MRLVLDAWIDRSSAMVSCRPSSRCAVTSCFAAAGWAEPWVFEVTPAPGARRDV